MLGLKNVRAMKRGIVFAIAAVLLGGCAQNYPVNNSVQVNTSNSVLLNNGQTTVNLAFTALNAAGAQVVTVNQPPANANTVFTATPSAGCAGIASVAGTATGTTSNGPSGTFTFTALAIAPAGSCTYTISSSTAGPSATVTVDTSNA